MENNIQFASENLEVFVGANFIGCVGELIDSMGEKNLFGSNFFKLTEEAGR